MGWEPPAARSETRPIVLGHPSERVGVLSLHPSEFRRGVLLRPFQLSPRAVELKLASVHPIARVVHRSERGLHPIVDRAVVLAVALCASPPRKLVLLLD